LSIRTASNRATDLLTRCNVQDTPPVNVKAIADCLGVKLVERPNLRHPDHGDVSGLLLRKRGLTVCVINADQHPKRRRFTIAHELGHFLLHPPQESYVDARFTVDARGETASEGTVHQEIEANAFAAELLMPECMVRAAVAGPIDVFNDDRVQELAKEFKVSSQAMTYRLINLDLLPG